LTFLVAEKAISYLFTKGAVNRALIEMSNAGVKPLYAEQDLEALASESCPAPSKCMLSE
jgi:hypothetical protein